MLPVKVCINCVCFPRRKMEISQKAAEEEERYKKEMERCTAHCYFDGHEFPSKYCLNAYKISYTCVGLRLSRGNTTESGRRTMVQTDPRAQSPVQRPHHQRHMR